MTPIDSKSQSEKEDVIPRLAKKEMTGDIPYECEISRYLGSKKPIPSENTMTVTVPKITILARTAILKTRIN